VPIYAYPARARCQFAWAGTVVCRQVTLHNFSGRWGRNRTRYKLTRANAGRAVSTRPEVTRLATNQASGDVSIAACVSSPAEHGQIMWSAIATFLATCEGNSMGYLGMRVSTYFAREGSREGVDEGNLAEAVPGWSRPARARNVRGGLRLARPRSVSPEKDGTTLFPFRRLFVVVTKL
jgi:hypothetical protein